jgi:hypothetical protein
MSEDKISDDKPETIVESSLDSAQESVKTKKLSQLAAARESAKMKKRKREEELDSMSERLDKLTSLLTAKQEEPRDEEETPKVKRPKRVTREPDTPVQETQEDSWTTSLIRTGSLISLAGLSYYFQNMYGKAKNPQKKKIEKPSFFKHVQPSHISNTAVGMSGFTL